jgi:DNA-directed RNA polymerase subunit RPC12/RpoP
MTAETIYQCDRCGAEFITLEALREHQATTCKSQKQCKEITSMYVV